MSNFEKYNLSVQSPMGKQESELFLAQDDNQLTGNGCEAEAEHGVAGGDGGVSEAGDGADAGETIGSAGAKAGPRLNAGEIVRREGGEEFAEAFDDALKALGVYGQIGAANFHGSADAEFAAHGGDGDAGFLEQ